MMMVELGVSPPRWGAHTCAVQRFEFCTKEQKDDSILSQRQASDGYDGSITLAV